MLLALVFVSNPYLYDQVHGMTQHEVIGRFDSLSSGLAVCRRVRAQIETAVRLRTGVLRIQQTAQAGRAQGRSAQPQERCEAVDYTFNLAPGVFMQAVRCRQQDQSLYRIQ